jgi:hypothetical protein
MMKKGMHRWIKYIGTGDAKAEKLQTPALEKNEQEYQTKRPARQQTTPWNQSSKTTTSNALARSSTPLLLLVVASDAAFRSFSSLYFLPSASMTSF